MLSRDILIAGASNQNYAPVSQVTCMNRLAYAQRHGYCFNIRRHSEELTDLKSISREKAEFMRSALDLSEWVFWMDFDAIFTNFTAKIESIIEANPGKDFMICRDVNGPNNGVMLIRSTIATRAFMDLVISICDQHAHENAAMVHLFNHLIMPNPAINLSVLDNRVFNSMPYWLYPYEDRSGEWRQGDFIFHAPGMEIAEKVAVIKEILPQVMQ